VGRRDHARPDRAGAAELGRVDLDLLGLDALGLRKLHGQHAVPVGRLDLPGLDGNRKRKRPLEPALLTVVARLARLVAPLPLPYMSTGGVTARSISPDGEGCPKKLSKSRFTCVSPCLRGSCPGLDMSVYDLYSLSLPMSNRN